MHEVETAAPFSWKREEIGCAIIDGAMRKAPLRPVDRGADEVESRDRRAACCERFGVVAEPAADIERAQACERSLPHEPVHEQRMRREIAPGHAGGVAFREPIDGLEPVAAQRIGVGPALLPMRVDGVEPCARGLAARAELRAQALLWRDFSTHFPFSSS